MSPHQIRPDRRAATLLATAAVLIGGLSVCVAIVLVFAERLAWPVAVAGGTALTLVVIAVTFRDSRVPHQRGRFLWVFNRGSRPARVSYSLKKSPTEQPVRDNGPPTLEQIRELKQGLNTWVPSQHRASQIRRQ